MIFTYYCTLRTRMYVQYLLLNVNSYMRSTKRLQKTTYTVVKNCLSPGMYVNKRLTFVILLGL
jgi:hypothetical protein